MRRLPVLLLISAVVVGCGDDDDDGVAARDAAGGAQAGKNGGAADAGGKPAGARLVEVIATEYHLNPSRIYAAPGEHLILSLRNEGSEDHSFELDLPSGDKDLDDHVAPHKTGKLDVTLPTSEDEYTYYCPIGDHRQRGMEGTLVVRKSPQVALQPVAEGLSSPVAMALAPDDSSRMFVVDQVGTIRVIADGTLVSEPFLDLRDRVIELKTDYDERGLLGLAFHPDFASNGRFFVYYAAPLRDGAPDGWDNTTYLSEFKVSSSNADTADPGSERVLMTVDQPQANHEGGTIAFGPDKLLYLSLGDGGGAGDVDMGHNDTIGNGQDTSELLGSIVRIDVDSGGEQPYGIPDDNPFVNADGADEIYAYGFRNPYRFSFDMGGDQALFVGDAGQERWEEIDQVGKGGNYGWNILEGTHCFDRGDFGKSKPTCAAKGAAGEDLRWPVIEFANSAQDGGLGTAVVGGYVYRGHALPKALQGRYLFGVYSLSQDSDRAQLLVASDADGDGDDLWPVERVATSDNSDGTLGSFLKGFGQDQDGELYLLTSGEAGPTGTTGAVMKVVPAQ